MPDRRQDMRSKVLYGGVTAARNEDAAVDCVVRNISDTGACVELERPTKLPEDVRLSIPRKHRSYLARMIWRQANKIGLAFRIMTEDAPTSDLDERLRRSERKKRQLQRRIKQLLGEG